MHNTLYTATHFNMMYEFICQDYIWLRPYPASGSSAISMVPNYSDALYFLPEAEQTLLVGSFYYRHSTDPADLIKVNSLICGQFDGVFVITLVCFGFNAEVRTHFNCLLSEHTI